MRLGDKEEINREKVLTALRKALRFTSAIQGSDGHWPAEFSGPMFLMPPLVWFFSFFSKSFDTYLILFILKKMYIVRKITTDSFCTERRDYENIFKIAVDLCYNNF